MSNEAGAKLSHSELLQLKRWNTPTIYNGWEQITTLDAAAPVTNLEETKDFMPQMGPMVGYAVTMIVEDVRSSRGQAKTPLLREKNRSFLSFPARFEVSLRLVEFPPLRF